MAADYLKSQRISKFAMEDSRSAVTAWRDRLQRGVVIPAHPLALTPERKLDERRQRGLTRYYTAAGAGGVAVGVHTTQFEIREPRHRLFHPVLELASEELRESNLIRIAGVCGTTNQAVREATLARDLGFHLCLLSLAALPNASEDQLIQHASAVGDVLPLMGFFLQPAAGGRLLTYSFWRRFVELDSVLAIKVAPFNRYQTLDVVRAVAESGRARHIALYTGNDDTIVSDLMTPYVFGSCCVRFVGGLLGHWSFWTRNAVELLSRVHAVLNRGAGVPEDLLRTGQQITDVNAAVFDPSHQFRGCVPGIHEMLCRCGLLAGRWCLDPGQDLSAGQREEIDRVEKAYPHLSDRDFVRQHLDEWLS